MSSLDVARKGFDEGLFESLKPGYEEHRAMLTEWLVAYCEHTKVELPSYCMNANQKEAFDQLQQAIEAADIEELKRAVIAAKTVPDLKSHEELSQEFGRALEILKEKSHLPPGASLHVKLHVKLPKTDRLESGRFAGHREDVQETL